MKQVCIVLFIFLSLFTFCTLTNSGELYNCIDSNGNNIITDSPQNGMKDCVLKDSFTDSLPKERSRQQKKSSKNRPPDQIEAEKEKERAEAEQEEAALIRAGNKCHTQVLNLISGGSVSDVFYWRICKDKNGNVISKRRLKN